MAECTNRMKNGYDSFTFEEYTKMEKELTDSIINLFKIHQTNIV